MSINPNLWPFINDAFQRMLEEKGIRSAVARTVDLSSLASAGGGAAPEPALAVTVGEIVPGSPPRSLVWANEFYGLGALPDLIPSEAIISSWSLSFTTDTESANPVDVTVSDYGDSCEIGVVMNGTPFTVGQFVAALNISLAAYPVATWASPPDDTDPTAFDIESNNDNYFYAPAAESSRTVTVQQLTAPGGTPTARPTVPVHFQPLMGYQGRVLFPDETGQVQLRVIDPSGEGGDPFMWYSIRELGAKTLPVDVLVDFTPAE